MILSSLSLWNQHHHHYNHLTMTPRQGILALIVGVVILSLLGISNIFRMSYSYSTDYNNMMLWDGGNAAPSYSGGDNTIRHRFHGGNALIAQQRQYQQPELVTVVMTFDRPHALQRCLDSLHINQYPINQNFPLKISIDKPAIYSSAWNNTESVTKRKQTISMAESYNWTHGDKYLHIRSRHAGLATQWFESWNPIIIPQQEQETNNNNNNNKDYYISIVEDDLEYSPVYYDFLRQVEHYFNPLHDSRVAMICLHQRKRPRSGRYSDSFAFLTGFDGYTCSWGAIWKASEWRKFTLWLQDHRDYMTPHIGDKAFDQWIAEKRDLQSIWTAKYLQDTGLQFLNFDLQDVSSGKSYRDIVINHREAGANYATKQYVDVTTLAKNQTYLPSHEEWMKARKRLEIVKYVK